MTINIKGNDIVLEKVDYDLAYYIYNTQYNIDDEFCKKATDKLYVYDDEKYSDYENDIWLECKKIDKDICAIPKSLFELFEHCKKHNKYGANIFPRGNHLFGCIANKYRKIFIDEILKIEDDECLSYLLDFITVVGPDTVRSEHDSYQNYCIIKYFLKDYEEYKEVFKYIGDEFRKYSVTKDEEAREKFYTLATAMLYRMFLQYNDDFVYMPVMLDRGYVQTETSLRFKNPNHVLIDDISSEEQDIILAFGIEKIQEIKNK